MNFSVFIQEGNKGRDNRYPVSIRIFHNKGRRFIGTIYRVPRSALTKEFNLKDPIILSECAKIIVEYEELIKRAGGMVRSWTCEQVKTYLVKKTSGADEIPDFFDFANKYIEKFKDKSKGGYKSMINKIEKFHKKPLPATEVTEKFVKNFHAFLIENKVGQRSQNVHLTLFKAVFNALKDDCNDEDSGVIVVPNNPFKKFEMPKNPIPKKRNVSKEKLLELLNCEAPNELAEFGRDVFFISFLLCGTNLIDLYNIENLDNSRISYNRKKTAGRRNDNAFTSYNVEPELIPYLEKHKGKTRLFDFSERYKNNDNFIRAVNNGLRYFVELIGLPENFTSYYARHSWATIARNRCRIPKDDISLCLNHSTGRTVTDEYIESDFSLIDEANRKVIDFVFG